MMKKAVILILIFCIAGYMGYAIINTFGDTQNLKCERFEVRIKDSTNSNFISGEKIKSNLSKKGLNPEGKHFNEINTYDIEQAIIEQGAVKNANVYISQNSSIFVNVETRKPLIRVMTDRNLDFYVDSERKVFPAGGGNAIELPLITGDLDEETATGDLFDFALYLRNNKTWDDLFEQIVVKKGGDIVLIPRVGDFKIIFGKPNDFKEKFYKLEKFQSKGLKHIGWNKFSTINLKYEKQIVCTKK